jgi:guanylate cyclase
MKQGFLGPLVSRIGLIGLDPAEDDHQRIRRMIYVGASFAAVVALLFYGWLFVYYGAPWAALVMFVYLAVTIACVTLFGLTRRHFHRYLCTFLCAHLLASFFVTMVLGGFIASAVHAVWGLLAPLGALVVLQPKMAIGWFAGYVGVLAAALVFSRSAGTPLNTLDPGALLPLITINITGVSLFAFAILYYFVQQRDVAFSLLRDERERSEELLLNILPREVAAILKESPQVIADNFAGASILFADVADFTPMAARLTPEETVNLLNEVFSYFDQLVEKYDVEKIKTIGDCYMVASGVPRPRSDHAHVLVDMALAMREHVGRHQFGGHKIQFRIGINSGPVVAGVIGRKKFIYDLWGDAVNTASRMESHGSAGVIQITRATYELIKDAFVCEPRGTVEVKGKGAMEVWHVQGASGG